jgi:hypothetical protein
MKKRGGGGARRRTIKGVKVPGVSRPVKRKYPSGMGIRKKR